MNSHTRSHRDVNAEYRESPLEVDASPLLATAGDAEFIAAAYSLLFNRVPDPVGLVDYRFLLRAGYPRLEILRSLAQSEEAREKAVRVVNLPAQTPLGFWRRLGRFAWLKTRWLLWWFWERPNEIAEQLIAVAAPEKYWDLAYKSSVSDLHRQQRFESLLHLWRREMARDLSRIEAELGRLNREFKPAADAEFPGDSSGGIRFDGLRITLPRAESEELVRQAVSRHILPGTKSLLERTLRPGMTVFDSDAGCGVFSLIAARLVMPSGKVWAVAADMLHHSFLTRNLEANDLLQICVVMAPSGSGATRPLEDLLRSDGFRPDLVRLTGSTAASTGVADSILRLAALHPGLKVLCEFDADRASLAAGEAEALLDALRGAGFRSSRICPDTGVLLPVPQSPAGRLSLWIARDEESKEEPG
ncbi:MAG: DUF4214 domain-containing protein [Bryobacteraceae bacterium]|nr:DUF4214 domain-containing protein [Bryobacteraceae bacterium]